jgi:hypothetical protein
MIVSWLEKHMLPCAYKSLLGFDCPACGMQRSFIQLLKGEFTESFFLYPPLLPVISLIGLVFFKMIYKAGIKTELVRSYAIGVLVVVTLNYLIKLIFYHGS